MKIWGMGTCYGGYDDQTSIFIKNKIAAVGWSEDDAIDLYAMIGKVEISDIIYLKSTYPKKGIGRVLRIKTVGKVVNPNKKFDGKSAIGVDYIESFTPIDLVLKDYRCKNSVYGCTFYQEYNPLIIEKILHLIQDRK